MLVMMCIKNDNDDVLQKKLFYRKEKNYRFVFYNSFILK